MKNYQPVIGLEIHVELKTKSKMFCQCEANYFGKDPNTNTCPVCLGLPGALPVPNKKAIEWCILIGKALNCTIPTVSKFDRKHYFYPDLPKGYQISQYDEPIAVKGNLVIARSETTKQSQNGKGIATLPRILGVARNDIKTFGITRVHLEEDTGKLIHAGGDTLVDFNRSGVPLVEIVTEPDFDNSNDVKRFLEELHTIIRYLDVSDADMEKGSMRMEPNISLRIMSLRASAKQSNDEIASSADVRRLPRNDTLPNYKVEVKNINSFRFVKQAIEYELERQKEILEKGGIPKQETRGFDEKKVVTYSQRSKEEAQDYRYFPEPDIPPLEFTKEYVDSIKVPELPVHRMYRYIDRLKLRPTDAFVLTRDKDTAEYFEKIIANFRFSISKQIPNIKNQISNVEQSIVNFIINKKISTELSVEDFTKKVLELLTPKETDKGLLEESINKVLKENKGVIEQYKAGKQNALMFFVGQVMREMKGKADAKLVISKLKEYLK